MDDKIEVKIKWQGKDEVVILKKLTWGMENQCSRKSCEVVIKNGVPSKEVDQVTALEYQVLYSIEKAPFEKTIKMIRDLPRDVGNLLFNESRKLNGYSVGEEKNLESPSVKD